MNAAIEIVGYGGVVPGVVAITAFVLSRWLLPDDAGARHSGAWAFAAAFITGYVLLPDWADIIPSRHWHWLPYLSVMAAVLAPVGLASGVALAERWLLYGFLALVAAGLLVPTWESLQPRWIYAALLAGYFFVLAAWLGELPDRLSGGAGWIGLIVVSAATAISGAVFVSAKYGQVVGIATAAITGCGFANWLRTSPLAFRGVVPQFAVIVGGLAFVTSIEPEPALYVFLLIPAAPLMSWCCAWGPLSRLKGFAGAAVQLAVVFVPVAVAVAWLAVTVRAGSDGY